jgi:teichuronic acid biosynthesis glycosyltransferase TuaC
VTDPLLASAPPVDGTRASRRDQAPRLRVATVTTFFPNSADRHRSVFVENLVRAMSRRCQVDVISPVPFAPALPAFPDWYRQSQIPRRELIDGIEVEHPRFVVLPKLELGSGLTYAVGVSRALRRSRDGSTEFVVHGHCAYPDGVGVALAARQMKSPYVITAHGSDINVYARRKSLRWQIRWALRGAAAIIVVSQDLRSKVSQMLGPAAAPLLHIPCAGFDPAVFFPRVRSTLRHELGLRSEARLVIFVGQLVPIKSVDRLIEAWRLLQTAGRLAAHDRLVIIGEGRCGADLAQQAAAGQIADRVIFAGALTQPIVARWIGAADLLCLPSQNEGTPNVIVEALASGVPVVASRVGGIPELITHESNGLLVPPGDAVALADAIATVLARSWDPERLRQGVALSTWDTIAAETVECLRAAARGQPASVA